MMHVLHQVPLIHNSILMLHMHAIHGNLMITIAHVLGAGAGPSAGVVARGRAGETNVNVLITTDSKIGVPDKPPHAVGPKVPQVDTGET